jgi:hypothetical protein
MSFDPAAASIPLLERFRDITAGSTGLRARFLQSVTEARIERAREAQGLPTMEDRMAEAMREAPVEGAAEARAAGMGQVPEVLDPGPSPIAAARGRISPGGPIGQILLNPTTIAEDPAGPTEFATGERFRVIGGRLCPSR